MSNCEAPWRQYICRACGLIYNEKLGDPDSGLSAGTRFADIPEEWQCPLCGVRKTDFELFETPVMDYQAAQSMVMRRGEVADVIIVGAGIAGWSMAEAIRRLDSELSILIITACDGDLYHKPELSVAIGRGLNDRTLIREKGGQAAQRLGCSLLTKTFVTGISPRTKNLRSTRGSFRFSTLVLAQGAKSRVPNNIPLQWCWRINHLNHWRGLQHQLQLDSSRVAIVGAGMIGCELAENLCSAGHQVSLIFRDSTPLAKILPQVAGERFAKILSQQGIRCFPETTVENVEEVFAATKNTQVKTHYRLTTDKDSLEVDQIIVATGLAGDKRLAIMAGLQYNEGIVVNPRTLQTSETNIYALGDCISFDGEPCRFISPIVNQARVIASRICDADKHLSYQHQPPDIRLKIQSCSMLVKGKPNADGQWCLVSATDSEMTMHKKQGGELVSELKLLTR